MTEPLVTSFSDADFDADAKLIKVYAGIELERAVFERYAPKFTLSSKLGTSEQIEGDYHGFGTPRGVGNGQILGRILSLLESENIRLPSGPGTPLGHKISEYLAAGLSANRWVSIPSSYMLDGPDAGKMRRTVLWLNDPAPQGA